MSKKPEPHRGEDGLLLVIKALAEKTFSIGALTTDESWNSACQETAEIMKAQGLTTTANAAMSHIIDDAI